VGRVAIYVRNVEVLHLISEVYKITKSCTSENFQRGLNPVLRNGLDS
jgi:hypothetical protein